MFFIKKKLADAHVKRQLYRQQTLKAKMPIVSLIGYTSSGKTTLFNLLNSENKGMRVVNLQHYQQLQDHLQLKIII